MREQPDETPSGHATPTPGELGLEKPAPMTAGGERSAAGENPDRPTTEMPVAARLEEAAAEAAPAPEIGAADFDADTSALRDVHFTTMWRGYDPAAVDAYVAEVRRTLTRLSANTAPGEAVKRALDRVGEQTAGILREAELAAEQMTTRSRAQAEERLQRSEREAVQIRAAAQARVRNLDSDIERLWQERERLIADTRRLAEGLMRAANDAEQRFPPEEGAAGAAPANPFPPSPEPEPRDDETTVADAKARPSPRP